MCILSVDKKLLAKLPKYAQKLEWIQLEKASCGYDAICKAVPEDPRLEDGEIFEDVCFTADDLDELKFEVRMYVKDYRRFGYDY